MNADRSSDSVNLPSSSGEKYESQDSVYKIKIKFNSNHKSAEELERIDSLWAKVSAANRQQRISYDVENSETKQTPAEAPRQQLVTDPEEQIHINVNDNSESPSWKDLGKNFVDSRRLSFKGVIKKIVRPNVKNTQSADNELNSEVKKLAILRLENLKLSMPAVKRSWMARIQRKIELIGVSSLIFSILAHLFILAGVASFWVYQSSSVKEFDFLPGGSSVMGQMANYQLKQDKLNKKKVYSSSQDKKRIVVDRSNAAVILPDEVKSIELPATEGLSVLKHNKIGSSTFGGAGGSGSGLGGGRGIGAALMRTFKPITMFGVSLNAKNLGVVLDVSGSMQEFLPEVLHEVDLVANKAKVILYCGCGLMVREKNYPADDRIYSTKDKLFEDYWERLVGKQNRSLFNRFKERPNTYFVNDLSMDFTWVALQSEQFVSCDAIYWFADFQDRVEEEKMKEIKEYWKKRFKKLILHPSGDAGETGQIEKSIVIPTGGTVIRTEIK
jgi:hypothetical protein